MNSLWHSEFTWKLDVTQSRLEQRCQHQHHMNIIIQQTFLVNFTILHHLVIKKQQIKVKSTGFVFLNKLTWITHLVNVYGTFTNNNPIVVYPTGNPSIWTSQGNRVDNRYLCPHCQVCWRINIFFDLRFLARTMKFVTKRSI